MHTPAGLCLHAPTAGQTPCPSCHLISHDLPCAWLACTTCMAAATASISAQRLQRVSCLILILGTAAELKVSDAGSILAHTPWQRPAMQLGTRQAPAKTSSAHVPAVTQQSHPTQAQQPVAQEGQAESSGVVSTATDVALDLVQQDLPQRAVEHIIGAKHPAATSKLDEAADAESPTGQAQTTCLAEAGKPSTPLSEHPAGANSADALSPARARDQVVSPTAGSSVSRKARNACQPSVALPDSPEAAPAEAEDMVGSAEGCGPQSPAQSSSTFTNLTNNEIFSPDSHTMTGPAGTCWCKFGMCHKIFQLPTFEACMPCMRHAELIFIAALYMSAAATQLCFAFTKSFRQIEAHSSSTSYPACLSLIPMLAQPVVRHPSARLHLRGHAACQQQQGCSEIHWWRYLVWACRQGLPGRERDEPPYAACPCGGARQHRQPTGARSGGALQPARPRNHCQPATQQHRVCMPCIFSPVGSSPCRQPF